MIDFRSGALDGKDWQLFVCRGERSPFEFVAAFNDEEQALYAAKAAVEQPDVTTAELRFIVGAFRRTR